MTTRYRIGKLLFEPARRRLVGPDDRELALEPLVFDLLACLVDRADRVVTKEELGDEVWGGRPVSDSVIPHAVSKLRKVLNPYIEGDTVVVVHGRGYRLAVLPEPLESDAEPGNATPLSPRMIMAGSAICLALIVVIGSFFPDKRSDGSLPRIAILPIENQTGEDGLDWIRLGLLPVVESALASAGGDAVPPSHVLSTLSRYPHISDPVSQARRVANSTGSAAVLTARLTRSGERYVLTVTDLHGGAIPEFQLQGTNPPQMAAAAGPMIVEGLGSRSPIPDFNPTLTGDPFVDEAFARGLDARLRGDQEAALSYLSTVLNADPGFDPAIYQLSLVKRLRGDMSGARDLLLELERRAVERSDLRLQASVWSGLGILSWREDDLQGAEALFRQALDTYLGLGLDQQAAGQRVNLGILAANRGDYDTADAHFRASSDMYADSGNRYLQARVLKNLGVLALDRDELEQANDYLRRSLTIRRELELDREVALTLNALADVEAARGNFVEVAALQQRVLSTAQAASDPVLEALALKDLSRAQLEQGQVTSALEHAADALAVSQTMDNPTLIAAATKQLAHVHWAAGRLSRARELFEMALATHADSDRQAHLLALHIDLARLSLDEGDEARFTRHLETAQALSVQIKVASYEVDLLDLQARLHLQSGKHGEAMNTLRQARVRADKAGLRMKSQRIAAELGTLLLDQRTDASEASNLARDLLRAPTKTRETYVFLAALMAREQNFEQALHFAEKAREVSGELWTRADDETLHEYRSALNKS